MKQIVVFAALAILGASMPAQAACNPCDYERELSYAQ
jgi:hypothetical protein